MTILLVAGAYVLGAVPFGLLVVRLVTGRDIRAEGSGNIGATNVFRIAGPALGVVVLLLDMAKGAVPVLVARQIGAPPAVAVAMGLATIVGHNWPVFLKGKGGKGIATSYGVLLALSPVAGLIAAAIWVAAVAVTRFASLGSLVGVLSVPVVMLVRGEPFAHVVVGVAAAGMGVYRHRANIQRLIAGEELPLFGARKQDRV
jgi:glycerol-3-phosphate acyltransferase PlsY